MVHGLGEFWEGSFEGQWLPAFAAIQRQAVGTAAERSESEPWVGAVLIGATDGQVTATRGDVETTRRLARVEQ
jgi:hypothetical protein